MHFSTDKNGFPALYGVSLANTNVRNSVFRVMNAGGLKATIEMPSSIATNPGLDANFERAVESMRGAGLLNGN